MCGSITGGNILPDEDDVQSEDVSTELFFEILSDEERQYALYCLASVQNPLGLADLADEVACRKYDKPLPQIPAEDVKRIYMRLYHMHVPKMEDGNIVEYDQRRDTVRLVHHFADLDYDELV